MVVQNAQGARWTQLDETTPSGVTTVTHTGMEDYDFIFSEFSDVETSSSGFVYFQVGQGATPTYQQAFYINWLTSNSTYYATNAIYPRNGTAQTGDRHGSLLIINPGRHYTDSGTSIKIPFECAGYGAPGTDETSNVGNVAGTQEPITAIRIVASAGNLQGTGAVIRTWGYR